MDAQDLRGDKTMVSSENEFYDSVRSDNPSPDVPGESIPQRYSAENAEAAHLSDPVLVTAREHLSRGDLARALHAYSHLIRRSRSLDEITPDLAQLIKSYPQDALLWQTLGDALTRSGNPDHAEKAYAQAEKLMR